MTTQDDNSEAMAALAQETALKVGCRAVRWWQNRSDPRRLYIEANHTLLNGQLFPVLLQAIVPQLQERSIQDKQKEDQSAVQRAGTTMPTVLKKPLKRRDFLTRNTTDDTLSRRTQI